jgi:hypothetical protein
MNCNTVADNYVNNKLGFSLKTTNRQFFSLPKAYSLAFLILVAFSLEAQKNTYQLVRSINEQWLCFDKSYNHYVAYTENLHQNSQMLHFWLKPEQWKPYFLLLHLQEDSYLFINHNIQKKLSKGQHFVSLDSLAAIYPKKMLFFSLYASKAKFLKETWIVNAKPSSQKVSSTEVWSNRAFNTLLRGRVSLLLLALLLGYAFLRQYDPKVLFTYLQISKFLQIQRRLDNPLFIRFFQNSNLIFLLLYLLLTTSFLVIMEAIAPPNEAFVLGKYNNALSGYKLSWVNALIWLALSLIWLFAKYFLIIITANLLGLARIVNIHFYEYIRITHWFFLPLTIACMLLCLHVPYQMADWYEGLKFLLLLIYVMRVFFVAYNINSFAEFRKLDFYSYLCVSEIIPLFVYLKILFFT